MTVVDLRQNFARILRTLEGKGFKTTQIAKKMGYTTTTQLHNVLEGDSILSTKAIMRIIENLNVNPLYLFLGKGEMFLSDEDVSEVEKLRKENRELLQKHNEALKTIVELNEIIKQLEKKNDALIEISSAAIKYHKEHLDTGTDKEKEEKSKNEKE
ncbi:MAG: hypothetical protein J7K46_08500 [Bacteroidales bacterium]|nr:hypothetical protein [Bacteroidales bacterium]